MSQSIKMLRQVSNASKKISISFQWIISFVYVKKTSGCSKINLYLLRDHSLNAYAKVSRKLTFFNPLSVGKNY